MNITTTRWGRGLLLALTLVLALAGCRRDEMVIPTQVDPVIPPDASVVQYPTLLILNEGNMGSNKASIDAFDYRTGEFRVNLFPEQNPQVERELGDVGNDIALYEDKIFAVINCSNLVEVMDAKTLQHIGTIPVPNCRSLAYHKGKIYLSSFAGPVSFATKQTLGRIYRIDPKTLQVERKIEVGYQPEQVQIIGDTLYVVNSGGYRIDEGRDNTLSVVDLKTFREVRKDVIEMNMTTLLKDSQGILWITSAGDYKTKPGCLLAYDPVKRQVLTRIDQGIQALTIEGDKLYAITSRYTAGQHDAPARQICIDTRTRKIIDEAFIKDGTQNRFFHPYGITVHPETKDIFIAEAGNYVSPGTLFCFSADGRLKWEHRTGDIPGHFLWLPYQLSLKYAAGSNEFVAEKGRNPYVDRVLEFRQAPGQFVGELPMASPRETEETMRMKAQYCVANNKQQMVSLGGFGGYITVAFDHTVKNHEGRDLRINGNAMFSTIGSGVPFRNGWSEPGVVYVAQDKNHNGKPDPDEWYELEGSAAKPRAWKVYMDTLGYNQDYIADYAVTYERPVKEPTEFNEGPQHSNALKYIHWTDNRGRSGWMSKNAYHTTCSYYPEWRWSEDKITFRGRKLPDNTLLDKSVNFWVSIFYDYGYVDNLPNSDENGSTFDIDWAIDKSGKPVKLDGIDFVRVQTAVHQPDCGWVGEVSTEFLGATDMHLEKELKLGGKKNEGKSLVLEPRPQFLWLRR